MGIIESALKWLHKHGGKMLAPCVQNFSFGLALNFQLLPDEKCRHN